IYEDASEWPSEGVISGAVMDDAYHLAKDRVVAQFEKEYLTRLIGRAGGNMSKAARLASIDRTTLYRLMDKHEFHREQTAGTAGGFPGARAPPARRRALPDAAARVGPGWPDHIGHRAGAVGRAARRGAVDPGRVGAGAGA